MNDSKYTLVTTIQGIRDYIGDADVVAFDFETSPDTAYREDNKSNTRNRNEQYASVTGSLNNCSMQII